MLDILAEDSTATRKQRLRYISSRGTVGRGNSRLGLEGGLLDTFADGIRRLRTHFWSGRARAERDYAMLSYDMQYLHFVFATKEFLCRYHRQVNVEIERALEAERVAGVHREALDRDNRELLEKLYSIEENALKSLEKSEALARTVNELNREKSHSVPSARLAEAEHALAAMRESQQSAEAERERLAARVKHLEGEREESDEIATRARDEAARAEARLNHMRRDLELKEIQVSSLENMIARREQEIDALQGSHREEGRTERSRALENEREKLFQDNTLLAKENETLRRRIEDKNDELQRLTGGAELGAGNANAQEYESLLAFYSEKNRKFSDLQRLQEGNLKTLAERCVFLEETVEKLKREKETLAWGSSARRPLGLAALGEDEGEGEPEEDSQTVVEKGSFSVSGGNKTGEFRVPPLVLHKYKGSDPFE